MAEHEKHIVETERLILQQLSAEEHLNDYHLLWSSPEAVQWSSTHPIRTIEESKKWMLEETKAFNPKIENFAVLLKDSRNDEGKLRMIGKVGIFQFPAEISWMLHPDFWGIGYASEAIKGYLEWYWQDEASSDVHSIGAYIDPDNTASIRIAERSGFKRSHIEKEAYTTASKGLRDLIVYRILRPNPYIAETKRLYLQETSIEKHLLEIHAWNCLPDAMKWSSANSPTCVEDTIAWMHARTRVSDVRIENCVILLKPSNPKDKPELVGLVGIIRFPAEIGYKIIPKHQGKGYISEALSAFLYFFWGLQSARDTEEILAEIDPANEPSKKVVRKADFHYRGVITVDLHSEPNDLECWVLKRPRWLAESTRLVFEELDVEKHVEDAFDMWSQARHFMYLGNINPCKSIEDARKMLVPRVKSIDQPQIRHLAILLKPSSDGDGDPSGKLQMIGIVGVRRWPAGLWTHLQAGNSLKTFNIKEDLEAPELGYEINSRYWGKGYASEAVGTFLDYYWKLTDNHHQQIKKIVAWINSTHGASQKVLEKNGFKKERDLRTDKPNGEEDVTIFEMYRP